MINTFFLKIESLANCGHISKTHHAIIFFVYYDLLCFIPYLSQLQRGSSVYSPIGSSCHENVWSG